MAEFQFSDINFFMLLHKSDQQHESNLIGGYRVTTHPSFSRQIFAQEVGQVSGKISRFHHRVCLKGLMEKHWNIYPMLFLADSDKFRRLTEHICLWPQETGAPNTLTEWVKHDIDLILIQTCRQGNVR